MKQPILALLPRWRIDMPRTRSKVVRRVSIAPTEPGSPDGTETIAQRLRQYGRAITVRELCAVLHVSKQNIYKMAEQDVIPYFKFGGVIRFDPVRVADWMDELSR